MMLLLASVAGAFGALTRYVVSGVVQEATGSDFPIGTLSVNLVAAFILGLVAGIDQLDSLPTLTAAAFLGGFSTFSTWMVETLRLGPSPASNRAVLNLGVTLLAGVALAGIGYSLT